MKKIICTLLVILMTFSCVACATNKEVTEPPSAATETLVEEKTSETVPVAETEEPTISEETIDLQEAFEAENPAANIEEYPDPTNAEELLSAEGTQTITLNSMQEYQDFLRKLGYQEVLFVTDGIDESSLYRPGKLTYNNKAFKLEFKYTCWNFFTSAVFQADWILYGQKANSVANITSLPMDSYLDVSTSTRTQSHLKERSPYYCDILDIICLKNTSGATDWMSQYYYPYSGSLYNFVGYPDAKNNCASSCPSMLRMPGENDYVIYQWEQNGLPKFAIKFDMDDDFSGMVAYYYEAGMTLVDWANSEYNVDGWQIEDNMWVYHEGYKSAVLVLDDSDNLLTIEEIAINNEIMASVWPLN